MRFSLRNSSCRRQRNMGHFGLIILAFTATLFCCVYGQNKSCELTYITATIKELNVSDSEVDNVRADAEFRAYFSGKACVLNITQIYTYVEEHSTAVNDQFLIDITFVCYERARISLSIPELNNTYEDRYMLSLNFKEFCFVTQDFLTNVSLSKSTLITELYIDNDQLTGTPNQTCTFSSTLRTLNFSLKENMINILDICTDNFTLVYALTLRSGSVVTERLAARYIQLLETRFPNVQQFRIINLIPEGKIFFPWTSVLARMSENTGRAIHFVTEPSANEMKHSSTHSPHEIERWFKYKRIPEQDKPRTSGSDFLQFNGAVKQITITGLTVKSFEKECFPGAQDLQSLSLSNNGLQHINTGQFKWLSSLVELDISHNYLVSLDSDVFEDLLSLLDLDLSFNKLINLKDSLLRNCKSVERINLQNNMLQVLTDQFFKPVFISVRYVYLAFNPMLHVPDALIYAPNIHLIDMHNTLINGPSLMDSIVRLNEPDMEIRFSLRSFSDSNTANSTYVLDRKLDLSYCNIHYLLDTATIFYEAGGERIFLGLLRLIQEFNVDFWGNPFDCACNITNFQDVIKFAINDSSYTRSSAKTLICDSPPHLQGRQLVSITQKEIYCPVKLSDCPLQCVCSLRGDNSSIIIDCQHLNLTELPDTLPTYALELWFQNSSIQHIFPRKYFGDVVLLDLRNSKVSYISPAVFRQMASLKYLHLESNLITSIPSHITYLNLNRVTLRNNPFLCDCRLKWMKAWILSKEAVVEDWKFIKCTDGSEEKGTQLIALEDSEFTCSEDTSFDSVQHVFLPSFVTGCVLVVFVIVSLLVYFQRMTVKILLYVYCGFHPFDGDGRETDTVEIFDAVAIYDFDDKIFMQEKVINYLSDKGYKVADMYMDFIVGLSFSENVKHFIARSRRLIMCLSENTLQDELMHLTWSLAYEKSLHSKTNFVVLIENNCNTDNVKDKLLRRYLNNKRYIRKNSPMFRRCLDYFMPNTIERLEGTQCFMRERNAYIVYPDTLHEYVKHELIPNIREKTVIELELFEFHFLPGNSVDEEILEVLDRCHRLIFILSNETLKDRIKMMILKNAIAKSMACDHNYLLLFTSGQILESDLSRDVKTYVNNHVTVRIEDRCFIPRFCAALTTEYSTGGELENYMAMDEGLNIPLV